MRLNIGNVDAESYHKGGSTGKIENFEPREKFWHSHFFFLTSSSPVVFSSEKVYAMSYFLFEKSQPRYFILLLNYDT